MGGALNALVTFSSNGERNRASNAVNAWVASYNANHPNAVFTGQTANTTYQYDGTDLVHPNVSARAMSVAYTCTDYSGIEDAQLAIAQDINANAYWDIVTLNTWLI